MGDTAVGAAKRGSANSLHTAVFSTKLITIETRNFEMKKLHAKITCARWALQDKQKGLTTVEYAVAGALVAATLVAAFAALGTQVENVIEFLTTQITPPAG